LEIKKRLVKTVGLEVLKFEGLGFAERGAAREDLDVLWRLRAKGYKTGLYMLLPREGSFLGGFILYLRKWRNHAS
jgi:hypothetical protein